MKIYLEEAPDSSLQAITFRADEGETLEGLKAEVKTWMSAHHPMGWEEFFGRLTILEAGRIAISMV